MPLSRRALEGRFVRLLGRTPHEQLLMFRIERAKQLLCDTDLPVKSIAPLVGVSSPEYLSVMFTRLLGITPSRFREQHHASSATGS
ncbi:MAG: helix-turn-helix transcriptional regulator [Tepidisphaeraceae bacterium]